MAGGPPKLWQSESIPAWEQNGYSTPSVADGRVYLFVTMSISGQWRDVIYCISASNGSTLWRKDVVWQVQNTYDSGSAVAIYNGYVYVANSNQGEIGSGYSGTALCVELETGTVAWEAPLPNLSYFCPPLADGKLQCGGCLRSSRRSQRRPWRERD